jgi:hypothetical protein
VEWRGLLGGLRWVVGRQVRGILWLYRYQGYRLCNTADRSGVYDFIFDDGGGATKEWAVLTSVGRMMTFRLQDPLLLTSVA